MSESIPPPKYPGRSDPGCLSCGEGRDGPPLADVDNGRFCRNPAAHRTAVPFGYWRLMGGSRWEIVKGPEHNHVTRDIKSWGDGCPACDKFHERQYKTPQI